MEKVFIRLIRFRLAYFATAMIWNGIPVSGVYILQKSLIGREGIKKWAHKMVTFVKSIAV